MKNNPRFSERAYITKKTAPRGSFLYCLLNGSDVDSLSSVVAAAAENNDYSKDNNPGAVVVKDVA